MKSIRSTPSVHGVQGDERPRVMWVLIPGQTVWRRFPDELTGEEILRDEEYRILIRRDRPEFQSAPTVGDKP